MINQFPDDWIVPCWYCQEYAELIADYPINSAVTSHQDADTPRCALHFEFACNICDINYHFNGISWCSDCKIFTCINCSDASIKDFDFLIYDYYFEISCHNCSQMNSALDAAEYLLSHPYQIGDLRPESNIQLWIPMGENFPQSESKGKGRLFNYRGLKSVKLEKPHDNVVFWDKIAEYWSEQILHDDYHLHVLHPTILERLPNLDGLKLLDFGCGPGGLTRKLVQATEVVGLDPSNMIDLALKLENEYPVGIKYLKTTIEQISGDFTSYFDVIVSNMVLMDIENLENTLRKLYYVTKDGGKFFATISHPCYNTPAMYSIRVPRGSYRNEDQYKNMSNYFDEGTYNVRQINSDRVGTPVFHRKLSTYINTILRTKWTIIEVFEPEPVEEAIKKHPKQLFRKSQWYPLFLGFVLQK